VEKGLEPTVGPPMDLWTPTPPTGNHTFKSFPGLGTNLGYFKFFSFAIFY
jgi:hypothetical protein